MVFCTVDGEMPARSAVRAPALRSPFVGRAAELEMLRTLMPSAPGEGCRLVLLAGEPGAGKSRLLHELAGDAGIEDAWLLRGSCDATVRTPYGPFAEALGQLVERAEPAELRAALGAGGAELTRLLPDLPARIGELAAPLEADPDTERHRLHTAVANLLAGASRETPLVMMLEDCHWADAPTLLLLRHLVRSRPAGRMLLLATFRDAEADLSPPLAEALADLRRSDDVVRIRLEGLSESEVAELVRNAAGAAADAAPAELARAIHELTGGNAFLVCELWRDLVETGTVEIAGGEIRTRRPLAEIGTPESVREVVSQRLARLGPGTTDLLELAATAGAEFELEPVRRAAGLTETELLATLEEAVASGMVEELPSRRLAYRFAHELVRRALYDRLSRARRAELHLRVAEALEQGTAAERDLADLAHHFGAAAPLGGPERAVEYNLRAARAASAALAFEEATSGLRVALEIGLEDDAERVGALIDLGVACHRGGDATEALAAFDAAAEIARRLGSGELLARAAIGYEEACWRPALHSQTAIELLEEALAALDEDEDELRLALLAGLARALGLQGEPERAALVRDGAVAIGRRHGNSVGLSRVLARSYWARGSTPLEQILARLTEARDLAAEGGDAEIHADAMAWRATTFVALGDLASARSEVIELREMAERTGQPFMLHVAEHYGSALALCDGRLAAAEEMAVRSHEWGKLLTGRDASGVYGFQMFSLRREQGRLAELAPSVRILAGGAERHGPWLPGLVAVLAELGMEREARAGLARIADGGLDRFRSSLWLATLSYLADAAAALGDERMAALVLPELEPFAGTTVMIGHLVCCYGSADRYLGMLAATLGESERAEAYFEAALERNREMGAETWLAHTGCAYAGFLRGQGDSGKPRAEALLRDAARIAERRGLAGLQAKIAGLGGIAPVTGLPDDLSPREAQILNLVAAGLSNREIGSSLSISEHTAANHVRSILRKTGCGNRTEAASYAHRHGIASE